MKRGTFKRQQYERPPRAPIQPLVGCRGVYAPAANEPVVVAKGIQAKPGKCSRTVIEADWIARAVEFGCVACWLDRQPSRPTAYHHIVVGGRRLGHLFGFGLCQPGHHMDGAQLGLISRHPYKARFEARYGTEFELLAMLKAELGPFDSAEYRP